MSLQRIRNEQRKFELIEKQNDVDDLLGELYTYIKCLLEFLWKQPKLVSNILSNSNIKDVKRYLAHLFSNNFYENILSDNNKEDQLLYIITLLLKKEINNLNIEEDNFNVNKAANKFLNESSCGYILEELYHKKNIQAFFKIIIIDLVEILELSLPSQEIIFDPERAKNILLLAKKIEEEKEENDKEKKDMIFLNKKFKKDNEEKLKLFDKKYQFGLPLEELKKKLEENDIKQNKDMYNYLNQKVMDCSQNSFLYCTEIFLEKINFSKMSNKTNEEYNDEERKIISKNILNIYKQSYFEVINIIDKLFNNLISNIHLLPYSIKCINKIISVLINKKFPNLPTFEKNIFISKFFFHNLFFPIFANPDISALINDFIISGNTLLNIYTIVNIINKFISGQFYKDIREEGIYTPLNWYFLQKMPILFEFFEKSKNVKLPKYVKKIIDNEENEFDYSNDFDYFEENEDEIVYVKNICFNFDDIYYLVQNMKNIKQQIFKGKNEKTRKMEKALDKLINNEYRLEAIKNILEENNQTDLNDSSRADYKTIKKTNISEKIENKHKLKYFLISELLFNKKYSNLFKIKNKKGYFNIKELENPEDNENNIIKAKNFICDLLYNFQSLEIMDLTEDLKNKLNIINILKEIKKYLKTYDLLSDEKIPIQWYINSIIEYLKKLGPNLIENDYTDLLDQLENDINNSIKLLNFQKISLLANKIKLIKKSHLFYDKAKKIIIDIDLNQQVHDILEKETIPVEIKFYYSDNKKQFDILPTQEIKGSTMKKITTKIWNSFLSSKNFQKKICRTIKDFTDLFPDLTEYSYLQDLNTLQIMEELEVPKKLMNYFNYIEEHIKKLDIQNEKRIKDINIKIYDYVMEKLYDKIFPIEPGKEDLKIFKNCVRCSWVELKHFVRGKNDYVLENFIPDTIKNFEQINKEKSPRKKLRCLNKIFTCIFNLAQLNGDMIEGTDDSLPILNYAFIKARPLCMDSNCKFMKLFLGEMKNKAEGHQLSQLIGIGLQISKISSDSFNDVSEEEFNKNCILASQEEL